MPISCHFWNCKLVLVTSLTHVSGAIASVQTFYKTVLYSRLSTVQFTVLYWVHAAALWRDGGPETMWHYDDEPRYRLFTMLNIASLTAVQRNPLLHCITPTYCLTCRMFTDKHWTWWRRSLLSDFFLQGSFKYTDQRILIRWSVYLKNTLQRGRATDSHIGQSAAL